MGCRLHRHRLARGSPRHRRPARPVTASDRGCTRRLPARVGAVAVAGAELRWRRAGVAVSRRPRVPHLSHRPFRRRGPPRAGNMGGVPFRRADPQRSCKECLGHDLCRLSRRSQHRLRFLSPTMDARWRTFRRLGPAGHRSSKDPRRPALSSHDPERRPGGPSALARIRLRAERPGLRPRRGCHDGQLVRLCRDERNPRQFNRQRTRGHRSPPCRSRLRQRFVERLLAARRRGGFASPFHRPGFSGALCQPRQ